MGDREERRIQAWLKRNGVSGLELTPLVRARIVARHRAERANWLGVALLLLAIPFSYDQGAAATIAWFTAAYLVLNAAVALGYWLQRRADQRIAQGLPQRVTRPEAARLTGVLGPGYLWAAAVLYGGGILLGALVAAWFPDDRALGVAFLGATTLFAGFAGGLLTDIVRRPAIADDEAALRADDRLRRVDAGAALAPYTVVLALVAAVNAELPVAWFFLGYAVVGLLAWVVPAMRAARASTPAGSPA